MQRSHQRAAELPPVSQCRVPVFGSSVHRAYRRYIRTWTSSGEIRPKRAPNSTEHVADSETFLPSGAHGWRCQHIPPHSHCRRHDANLADEVEDDVPCRQRRQRSAPSRLIRIVFGFFCTLVWVARICVSSPAPMPHDSEASAPLVQLGCRCSIQCQAEQGQAQFRRNHVHDAVPDVVRLEHGQAKVL